MKLMTGPAASWLARSIRLTSSFSRAESATEMRARSGHLRKSYLPGWTQKLPVENFSEPVEHAASASVAHPIPTKTHLRIVRTTPGSSRRTLSANPCEIAPNPGRQSTLDLFPSKHAPARVAAAPRPADASAAAG